MHVVFLPVMEYAINKFKKYIYTYTQHTTHTTHNTQHTTYNTHTHNTQNTHTHTTHTHTHTPHTHTHTYIYIIKPTANYHIAGCSNAITTYSSTRQAMYALHETRSRNHCCRR